MTPARPVALASGSSPADLVFVVAPANRGWVLDGISRDTCRALPDSVSARVHYGVEDLPTAGAYFFSHYSLFLHARRDLPRKAKTFVYYTHPREFGRRQRSFARRLSRCTMVLSMASMHTRGLIEMGFPAERVTTILGAADANLFHPHAREGIGVVGLVSAYYERKGPRLLLDTVRLAAHRRFMLVGRGWTESPIGPQLQALENLTIVESPPYAELPAIYQKMDVFLSVSELEGGPIPLIEAMQSNVVPVATRTGFAPDVIRTGENGFLCEVDAQATEVVRLLDAAYDLEADVRKSVQHLTFERYAAILLDLLAR